MRLLADENIPRLIVRLLRENGHEVTYIAETASAAPDNEILTFAIANDVILLTQDTDFGELAFKDGLEPPGIILLQLDPLSNAAKAELVTEIISKESENFKGALTVIEPSRVRIRPFTASS